MACLGVGVLAVVHRTWGCATTRTGAYPLIGILADAMVYLNLVLFFFNLLPVPRRWTGSQRPVLRAAPAASTASATSSSKWASCCSSIVFLVGGRLIAAPLQAPPTSALLQVAGLL
jgi:Zn-dependent protease